MVHITVSHKEVGRVEGGKFSTVTAAKRWYRNNFDNGFEASIWSKESDFLNGQHPDFVKDFGKSNFKAQ